MKDSSVAFTLAHGAHVPTRGSSGSSGYDLHAVDNTVIKARSIIVVPSGISISLPDSSWECQVRGRSSLSKRGLWVANGTVDSDYRGMIAVTIANITDIDHEISCGERYAQLVFARVEHPGRSFPQCSVSNERSGGATSAYCKRSPTIRATCSRQATRIRQSRRLADTTSRSTDNYRVPPARASK